jgi:lon-related putative ATP-dependent protease
MINKKNSKFLSYKLFCQTLSPKDLDFESTAELKSLKDFFGQERALKAIMFGIGIKKQGYNIFAMGPSGFGKRSLVKNILEQVAAKEPTPSDWCYIYNFEFPSKPIAIELPAGRGIALQQDMKKFVSAVSMHILGMFESDEYNDSIRKINTEFNRKRNKIGKKKKQKTILYKVPRLYKERHDKEIKLQKNLARITIDPLVNKLKNKYADIPIILEYLDGVKKDILAHVNEFIKNDESTNLLYFDMDIPCLINYQINLIVNNENRVGAPVLFEENPSYSNLICRIEHSTQDGVLFTNFTLIKPGSLHQANGGYLVIEARKLKKLREAWEGLKRALYNKKIMIETQDHSSFQTKTISLEPMPIPLNIKVILLGERDTYYSFNNNDSDFSELFKVTADFDEQIDRNKTNIKLYSRLIATIVRNENLKPFTAAAVASLINYSSRIVEDIKKLSMHIRFIYDLIFEADYWANVKNKKLVDGEDVIFAMNAKIFRLDRTRQLYYEDIYRKFVIIYSIGSVIGQVNALSVVRVGQFSYGHPTRVTAVVRAGKGKIIDIQREIKMAGASYSKGSLIISNFLASRYCDEELFSLSASIAFEQIYGRLDGDSASIAEVCALLSALSGVPIKQYLAVTGSMDQYGYVQSIGSVNEKIEGFFDICKLNGLNGKQGVLIPTVNVNNLMLRDEIIKAGKQNKFFIYPIQTIDNAIEILIGMAAGHKKNGKYPIHTINYLVEKKLIEFANKFRTTKVKRKK